MIGTTPGAIATHMAEMASIGAIVVASTNGEHAERQATSRALTAMLDGDAHPGQWLFVLREATFAVEEDGGEMDVAALFRPNALGAISVAARDADHVEAIAFACIVTELTAVDGEDPDDEALATLLDNSGIEGTLIRLG